MMQKTNTTHNLNTNTSKAAEAALARYLNAIDHGAKSLPLTSEEGDKELFDLLTIAAQLRSAPAVTPSPAFRERVRASLSHKLKMH